MVRKVLGRVQNVRVLIVLVQNVRVRKIKRTLISVKLGSLWYKWLIIMNKCLKIFVNMVHRDLSIEKRCGVEALFKEFIKVTVHLIRLSVVLFKCVDL